MGNYEFKREITKMEHKKQRIIQIVAISLTAVVIAVAVGLVFMFTKKDETPLNRQYYLGTYPNKTALYRFLQR